MPWKIKFSKTADKQIKKLSSFDAKRITQYLREHVINNPYAHGENLKWQLSGLRRYRIGNYRAICEIQDETITILVLEIGHRSKIYDRH